MTTDDCAREAIHLPGAVQPHGALIAISAGSGRVSHASTSLQKVLGVEACDAIGRVAASVIGEDACRALLGALRMPGLERSHIMQNSAGETLYLRSHRTGDHFCIDIEPFRTEPSSRLPIIAALSVVESFKAARTCVHLCESAVEGLRSIAGYGRVMAYRFGPDGDGEVVAEIRAPEMAPYLGLHYPASDIPPQARLQYLALHVGSVADANYVPAPLMESVDGGVSEPLDLTHSSLRSVSPFHREYMRNMGTVASLTVALLEGERLWGMLVCHHGSPRVAGPELRAAAGMIGQVVSLLIPSVTAFETLARQDSKHSSLMSLVAEMGASRPLADTLVACGSELLGLVDATGMIARVDGNWARVGRLPPQGTADRLIAELLAHDQSQLLALTDLPARFPTLGLAGEQACGALLLRLPRDDFAVWFRPEIGHTVHWGRNDRRTIADGTAADESLSPRASFETWKELVRGNSTAWTAADRGLASDLGHAIEAVITEKMRLSLRDSESRFRLLAEYSGVVVTLNDLHSVGRYVSPASESVLGWRPDEMIGRNALDLVHPDDREALLNERAALMDATTERSACYRFLRPDGSWLWVEAHVRLREANGGDAPGDHVVVLRDATERKAAETKLAQALERVERIASIDGLTGLSNRRHFDEMADKEWRRCERERVPLSLALLDVDYFKRFNDRYGHLAGDSALRAIASCVADAARRPADLAARYGGEEFLLLMPGTALAGAQVIAQDLCKAVERLAIAHADSPIGVITISLGVATAVPTSGKPEAQAIEPLLAAADVALYKANSDGRNRVMLAPRSFGEGS